MKRLFLFFIFLPALCFADNQQIINMMNLYSAASGYDVSNFTFWWDCEAADFSGTNGTTNYSAGDDTATLNGNAAINTDAVLYGTNGLDIPTNADYASFASTSIITDDDFIVGCAVKANTSWPGDGAKILRFWDSGDGDDLTISFGGSGEIDLRYLDAGVEQGSCTVTGLSVDTWYFVIGIYDETNDDVYLYIYNTSKNLIGSDSDLNTGLGAVEGLGFRIGYDGSAVSCDYAIEQIRISDSTSDLTTMLATMDSTDYSNP